MDSIAFLSPPVKSSSLTDSSYCTYHPFLGLKSNRSVGDSSEMMKRKMEGEIRETGSSYEKGYIQKRQEHYFNSSDIIAFLRGKRLPVK